ncbi:MAG: TonB-dependent receptor plug domain-containing protein [Candidatus Eisenbacteria bacterium]|nr:TonB-dependent receptor plug domain-containing protein [Candidatus Eisenbacteria bacterium]
MEESRRGRDSSAGVVGRASFGSREIALLGLMAALWGVIEITVGGMIKGWHIPFGGSILSAFGVVILLTARASVPRRWSSLLVGVAAGGIRFLSGFGGAAFAAIGIVTEAAIIELVLSLAPPRKQSRLLAGALAVLWALVHPFVVQGYLAGYGPERVFRFTIGFMTGQQSPASLQAILAIAFLALVHLLAGVSAVLFVDRILLAPSTRERGRRSEAAGHNPASRIPPGGAALVVVALILTLSPLPCDAQKTDPNSTTADGGTGPTYVLPELTVYGTRLFGPYSVFQLTSSEIDEAGAEDLSQALELVPGVAVRTDSRGEARLSTRGLAEREMVILVDGVPISDPYTGTVSSSMVLAGALGRVRVTKGPAASVYGANALGGIVEVATVAGDRTGLSYRLSAGDGGRYMGYLTGAGRVSGVRLAGGVAANGRSQYRLPSSFVADKWEDGGARDYSGREHVLAWCRAAWDMGARTDAALSVQVADGSWDVPASTSSDRPRFWRFPYWREVRTVGSIGFRPTDQLLIESKLYYGTNDNQLAAYSDFERTDRRWLSTVSNRALGGYVYSEYRGVAGHRLSGGLNVRGDLARLQSDVGMEWNRYEATTSSIYAQDVLAMTDSDKLAVALNTDMMFGEGRSLARLNPQAAWTHRLRSGRAVRLLAGMKTRFPTLKEWFGPEIGNAALKPERSVSVEVELSQRTPEGSRLSILGFKQSVEDMIVTSGWGSPAENLGSVSTWGAEVGVLHRLGRDLEVALTVAMTSARDAETNEFVPLIPRTMATLETTYERGPGTLMARVRRVGSRRGEGGGTLDPHYVVDLRGSFSTAWGDLFAGVDNAFDELYEDEDGFPQPGRSLEVGIARDLYR